MHQENKNQLHIPVLLDEVLTYLAPKAGETYLDLTAGYGGHASKVLAQTKNPAGAVLVDRDGAAIAELEKLFTKAGPQLMRADFYTASKQLKEQGKQFDLILADLGVSSPHLNQASRGFSLGQSGPLDMRMDQSQAVSAGTIVNTYPAKELEKILQQYGDEPKARQIARLIVEHRPLQTTTELATLAAKAWPGHSRVHPATRTFQALRIAVNDEMVLLEKSLPLWLDDLLAPGGRIAIISFHSLEDRAVKRAMVDRGGDRYDAEIRILTKRPVAGSSKELVFNPRARSAKLRVAVKQK